MSVTIKEIARLSGVSVSTVSRVLNNHPAVSDEVRKTVKKVIDEQHFVPHAGRASLRRPDTNSIGLLIRGAGNLFFAEMLHYFETEATKKGYNLVIRQINENDDEMTIAPVFVKEKNLKGIVLLGGKFDFSHSDVEKISVPFVCCTFTNSFGNVDACEYSSVCTDDIETGYNAVSHLIEKGHRRIAALLRDTQDKSISELRYQGYCRALKDADIEIDKNLVINCGDYSMKAAYDSTVRLIESGTEFTAVFSGSDAAAVAIMKALYDNDIKVPEDCSLIAVDGIELSEYTKPALTTMVQPKNEMATESVAILDRLIKGEGTQRHKIVCVKMRNGGTVSQHS